MLKNVAFSRFLWYIIGKEGKIMTIKQVLNPLRALFEARKRLNETREPATMEELQKLENQAIEYKEKGDSRLYNVLHTPIGKTRYRYLTDDRNVQKVSLYTAMNAIISDFPTKPFFIKNGDKFIAFIGYDEDEKDKKVISNVKLFNFNVDDPGNDTFKDTIELMNNLINNYKEVNFSAFVKNTDVVKVYQMYNKRHNGIEPRIEDGEIFFKIPGKYKD
jgi:hypothetical protein